MGSPQSSHSNLNFHSIRVFSDYREYDWRADAFLFEVNQLLSLWSKNSQKHVLRLTEVRTFKSYYLSSGYSSDQLKSIARELVCDPVIEDYSIDGFNQGKASRFLENFTFIAEIGYLPGVVDNEARTFLSAIKDYLKSDFVLNTHTASGEIYLLKFDSVSSSADLDNDEIIKTIEEIFYSTLVNPLIKRLAVEEISSKSDWDKCRSQFDNFFLEYLGQDGAASSETETVAIKHLFDDPEALQELSKSRLLYLSLDEMRAVIDYYRRPETEKKRKESGLPLEPTDVELEVIAQTWSEHCKHKIFAARIDYYEEGKFKERIDSLYRTYIKKVTADIQQHNDRLLSVFSDNSGVFRFTEDTAVCMKVETHNSPSALDPFGGAITGIVGVNRDIIGTGIGAKPIFNSDVFCFGYPDYSGPLPPKLFPPFRVMRGVHQGVERGGNESGIPTVNGAMVFDNRFLGKPLVFCGTGGLLPTKIFYQGREVDAVKKEIAPGDLIAMVGGRVGKDGIHGATFSSVALDESQPTSVVQIGDPIVQKNMTDFLLAARDRLLYRTLTDNGAGGLSSSVGELAQLSGGCRLELVKVLLKYPAMKPWEILVSESQERMTLAVPPENQKELEELAAEYDVEICFIGEFRDDGYLTASYNGTTVAQLGLDFLHEGVPQMSLRANWIKRIHPEPVIQMSGDDFYSTSLKKLLSRPNIASKESWVRRYDHEVKAISILKPFDGVDRDAPMNAAVLKPLRDSDKGLVVANGLSPRLSDIDSYAMAALAIDEAVRNAVSAGGNPDEMYALDNFCWPDPIASPDNPDGEYKLAQLVRANQALYDVCHSFRLPLISGKDSMKNDYGQGKDKISIPPCLLVTVLSVIPDYRRICSTAFKRVGSPVYLLGKPGLGLGGSEFLAMLGWVGNHLPDFSPELNYRTYQAVYRGIQDGLILAAHDLSDGGLAVALAESCFGGGKGVEVDIAPLPGEPSEKLFSEPGGCLIIETAEENEKEFLSAMREYTPHIHRLGQTVHQPRYKVFSSADNRVFRVLIDEDVSELKKIWKDALNFKF